MFSANRAGYSLGYLIEKEAFLVHEVSTLLGVMILFGGAEGSFMIAEGCFVMKVAHLRKWGLVG